MIDYWNRIITNLTIAEEGLCENIVSTASFAPTEFPTLLVDQLDNSDISADMEINQAAVRTHMELTAYSSNSLEEARTIINTACDAMRLMGFICNYGPRQVPNMKNANIYRMIARYSRVIGDGDQIPRFVTDSAGVSE